MSCCQNVLLPKCPYTILIISLVVAAISLCQARGYLHSYWVSLPSGQYQIILPSDRGTKVWITFPRLLNKLWNKPYLQRLWDPLRICAIPACFRGVFTTRRYTNPRLPLPLPSLCSSAQLGVQPSISWRRSSALLVASPLQLAWFRGIARILSGGALFLKKLATFF